MLDLALQTAVDLPIEQPAATTADTIRTVGDVGITLAAVKVAGMALRRGVVGYFTQGTDVDADAFRVERDDDAMRVMGAAYAVGVALTTAAVYLLASLPWALAWAGAGALLAAVVAGQAARNATPVDDVRAIIAARRHDPD